MENNGDKPCVGMGATMILWSDRHACTITRISKSGKKLWVKRDIAIRTDKNGMSESQTYKYEPSPNSEEESFSLREVGDRRVWIRVGSRIGHGPYLNIGIRNEYYDFSF